ncbi:MAG: TolC family protein [Cytophagales bacterium]|nr:TolC family protein [Cytophagales bacterium]
MKGIFTTAFAVLLCFSIYAQSPRTLTVQKCLEIAMENNLDIKRANLDLTSNEINLKQSQYSRLPNANLNWSYGFNWGRSIDPTSNQFISQRITSSGLNGNSNMVVYNGLRQFNTVKQNRVNIEASESDLSRAQNDLIINIANLFLGVILNEELLANAQYQLDNSRTQLDRTRILVESGALPITNQLELASQVASNEVALVNAQNNLDISMLNLKQAMLIPTSDEIELEIPEFQQIENPDLSMSSETAYGVAEQVMPEIKSADLLVESAQLGVKVAQGGIVPTVSVGGGFSTNYSDARDQRFVSDGTFSVSDNPTSAVTASGEAIFPLNPGGTFEKVGYTEQFDDNLSWNLGVGISIPIFNGLNTHSSIQRAKVQLQQAEIGSLQARNVLRQQVETIYTNAVAASKTYTASLRQVEALEETFRSIENQYNLGAANFTDYQVASNNLFQAKSDLVRAKYDFVFKKKVLDLYQGKPLSFE